jgi:hypothetical protein
MRTGRNEQAILKRNEGAAAEPVRGRVLVGLHAAEALIAQKRDEVAADDFQTVLHAIEELRIIRLGRQIHRQVDDFRMTSHWTVPTPGGRAHERALSDT